MIYIIRTGVWSGKLFCAFFPQGVVMHTFSPCKSLNVFFSKEKKNYHFHWGMSFSNTVVHRFSIQARQTLEIRQALRSDKYYQGFGLILILFMLLQSLMAAEPPHLLPIEFITDFTHTHTQWIITT